jgi:cytochrome bd-type quinol oxidase subunit 2
MTKARSSVEAPSERRSLWSRVYATATWALIVLFGLLAAVHVVLTILFYAGVHDQGFGYFFSSEWPAWLITVLDGAAAAMLWFGYRRGVEAPWQGFLLTLGASVLMFGRAAWMVFVPVLIVVTIAGSLGRSVAARRPS